MYNEDFIKKMPKELMAEIWDKYDWKTAEAELLENQQELVKAVYAGNDTRRIELQKRIVRSDAAKMLAVQKVCSTNGTQGTDKIVWRTSDEKYLAAQSLTSKNYHASPYRHIVIESKGGKKRHINIPTYYDRAMQVLYGFSLNPVAEAYAERKSFAFRKGRSMLDANEYIKEGIKNPQINYVIITDVMACYQSISHEWLLNNIPMDSRVLKEFLTAGYIFDGELFPTDDYGISLGCNISPILGNMTLDGIQKHIYKSIYGEDTADFANGNLIRFADDILITVNDIETAEKILKCMEIFMFERGLQLSEHKTQIVSVEEGFDFLSRHYERKNGIVTVCPSENAVNYELQKLEELILNHKGSQKSLIDKLNRKLTGFASYHKVSNAYHTFRQIDLFVKAHLMKLCEMKHPTWNIEKIKDKYWFLDFDGQYVYALKDKSDVRVKRLADTVISEHRKIKTNANPYLDADYLNARNDNKAIDSVTGKYRAVWNRQAGRCYYCGKKILADHRKEIVPMNLSKNMSVNNIAYIHWQCRNSPVEYAFTDSMPVSEIDIISVIQGLDKRKSKKGLKFEQLERFFQQSTTSSISLTFKEIENIIGESLCKSAFTKREYWCRTGENCISNSWLMNGYTIRRVYLDKKRITFHRTDYKNAAVDIPEVFLSGKIPKNAKCELENYFKFIKEKYGL